MRVFSFCCSGLLGFFHFRKALAAINRAIFAGLERYLCFCSAGCTSCCVHFARCASRVFAVVAAGFTSLGFVFESAGRIEFLFAGSESEFIATVFAY